MSVRSPSADISLEFNRHVVNLLDSLSALSELTALSIHSLDEAQLLRQALGALISNQDMERCSIFRLDDSGVLTNAAGLDWDDMLRDLVHPVVTPRGSRTKTRYRLGEGIMGHAAETGTIQHCPSCLDDPRFKAFSPNGNPVAGSLICVPIACDGHVLGVLNVFYPVSGFFNTWHERLLLLFCQVLGRLLLNHQFTHHLSTLASDKTQEIMRANDDLRAEITKRKNAQETLAQQHEFLKSVINSVSDPMMVIDGDYRLLMTNQATEREAWGAERSEKPYCYQVSYNRDTPCDGAEQQCPLKQVLETRMPVVIIHRHVDSAGALRSIEIRAEPIHNKSGEVIGIVESARDITERQRVEQELRIAATAFETKEGLFVTDVHGVILRVNRAFTEVTGYSAAEAVGNPPSVLKSGYHDDEFYRQFWQTLQEEKFWDGEVWNRRKNGEIYPEWMTISGVSGPDGCVSHYVGIFSDISKRKAEEEQIHSMAFYDPLTQLPNRRLLLDRFHQAMLASARRKNYGAVLFLDLDKFKSLNDTLGHAMGDLLLIEVARRLKSSVRGEDTAARLGGDEFVVMLEDLGEEGQAAKDHAKEVGEKILKALSAPYSLQAHVLRNSCSIGICLFNGTGIMASELLTRADKAMYQAKAAGGNVLRFFRADIREQ